MPEGRIIKALSGYYYAAPVDEQGALLPNEPVTQCRARGIFKKRGVSPLVGDRVIYSHTENGEGMIDEIHPRSTELIRPPVANTTLAVLVFSLREPDLNLPLMDKFLVHIEHAGLDTIICLTKRDLLEQQVQNDTALDTVRELYEQIGYRVLVTSSITGEGTQELKAMLAGEISVFSGQSGVGKSSMLNALVPGLALETSAISNKLGRGRHTTRHVELIPLDHGGLVADTPGFSQLDFLELGVEELSVCFREFSERSADCKFRACTHIHEPDCKVRDAVESGEIARSRYSSYVQFMEEMKEKKRRY